MRIQRYILSLVFALVCLNLHAQEPENSPPEKADTSALISKYLLDKYTRLPEHVQMDTLMSDLHHYNPVYDSSFSATFLGNTGQASETNLFFKRVKSPAFLFAKPYRIYLYNPFNTPHFNTHKPYTELKYITSGTRENSEQVLTALHTQNINRYANIGILYDVIASKGVYLHQEVAANRLALFGSYQKEKYGLFASVNTNSLRNQENGGLVDIENFLQHSASELNYRMFLTDAQSRLKYYSFFLTQKLNLGNSSQDSLSQRKASRFLAQHTIRYDRYVKLYSDNINPQDSLGFYQNHYYKIGGVSDSAFYQNLRNRFDLSMQFAGQSQELRVYAQHEYKTYAYLYPVPVTYQQNALVIDTVIGQIDRKTYNDISVGGQFKGFLGNWAYQARGYFYLTGYRQADLALDGVFTRYFSQKTRKMSLLGHLASLKPSYFLQHYGSSHFIWNNDFKNIDNIEAKLEYDDHKKLSAEVALDYFTGYIYVDSTALPAQYQDELLVASIYLKKQFDWGPVHHIHKILLQQPTSDYVHLPPLAYGNTTYFQTQVFKGALKFQVGFDFYYFLKYYGDAYMPATGMFYNQYDRMTGDYPYLTAFLNWRIKRTRFTLQYTNALAGIAGYNYFMAYRYPVFNSSLKFGLAWTFYD